jgi:hypothetical protein
MAGKNIIMNVVTSIGLQAASRTTLLKVITSNTIKALKVPAFRPASLLAQTLARGPGGRVGEPGVVCLRKFIAPEAPRTCALARAPPSD